MKKTTQFLIALLLPLSIVAQQQFSLQDFYSSDSLLTAKVDSVYNSLSEQERIAQMIITSAGELGKSVATVNKLASANKIGGVVFLKGYKKKHIQHINTLNSISKKNNSIPLLFSMDAEPSLFSSRIKGAKNVGKTIDIKTVEQSDQVTSTINKELKEIGVHHNYAPVLDVSAANEAIKSRSYGSNKDTVVALANRFILHTQKEGIIATAKHFPGHGLVKGDTHKRSVYIDGPLQEVANYKKIIEDGVLSIMIAHITIQNNDKYATDGIPSSCSRKIVTGLLKEEMGFKGIIISDALNIMKAVTILKNAPLLASKAGCDLILMPQNEERTMQNIYKETLSDPAYKKQVATSVKKIIRLKICAGIIQ
ncbi:glycoside hydrolase family 3 N-terminal domain-containing protein [Aquimarina hainanensis]|uniref:beta-N-acetylhexosaminidase n=1 Tax=Aquimarina hainanensis TaxID=1578017 RepID=A0ABW5N405_9FLAO|nr:glycoside hydrolase family 3 N-terminal domain-containing protein [Aquimarina sp. TRL1]QKX04753.1 glycoside hydrolase family 3 protein [Aquimarina sp. TRL1]